MALRKKRYTISTDRQNGLATIEERGVCAPADVADVEGNCCTRYELVPIPHSRGAVLKVMDGTMPALLRVTPPTIGRTFACVKVDGRANPFAPEQDGGVFSGDPVLAYTIVYQEVTAIA